jgi:hypothetical protein
MRRVDVGCLFAIALIFATPCRAGKIKVGPISTSSYGTSGFKLISQDPVVADGYTFELDLVCPSSVDCGSPDFVPDLIIEIPNLPTDTVVDISGLADEAAVFCEGTPFIGGCTSKDPFSGSLSQTSLTQPQQACLDSLNASFTPNTSGVGTLEFSAVSCSLASAVGSNAMELSDGSVASLDGVGISVAPTPEPSSLILLVVGLIGFWISVRRTIA